MQPASWGEQGLEWKRTLLSGGGGGDGGEQHRLESSHSGAEKKGSRAGRKRARWVKCRRLVLHGLTTPNPKPILSVVMLCCAVKCCGVRSMGHHWTVLSGYLTTNLCSEKLSLIIESKL